MFFKVSISLFVSTFLGDMAKIPLEELKSQNKTKIKII